MVIGLEIDIYETVNETINAETITDISQVNLHKVRWEDFDSATTYKDYSKLNPILAKKIIIHFVEEGYSKTRISKKFKCSRKTIYNILERYMETSDLTDHRRA